MKKGKIYSGIVEKVEFSNKGIIIIEDEKVVVKDVLEKQKIECVITKNRRDKKEGRLLQILEKAPNEIDPIWKDFGDCGGCLYQSISYEDQLKLKNNQVKSLLEELKVNFTMEEIEESPKVYNYRNKMEYSFGDTHKDGPLSLGLHKKNSMFDIVETNQCHLINSDYNKILTTVLNRFKEDGLTYYHKRKHQGYLRFLVVRLGEKTKELQINIVTSSQTNYDYSNIVKELLELELENKIVSILHTTNDDLADAVKADKMDTLHGEEYFFDEILGLKFKISPFSFFQTNTLGAEKLYSVVREYIGETKDKVVFDLYSGTGTITQLLAPVAKKAIGVEIVEEAVEAAKENAKLNNLENCEFIAGDVLTVLDEIQDKPDTIILDPPRSGIHPKALPKIINYGVENIVYVSCKPTSLVRDLKVFLENGYKIEKVKCVDMFPMTGHVEAIILMTRSGSGDKK